VMRYPRMLKRSRLTPDEIARHVKLVQRIGRILNNFDATPVPPISDPNDVHVVQAAVCANADYLCTLDQHFFEPPVVAFCADHGVTVITDVDLLDKLRQ
jgi:predicted nucleic acid-binding protein